MQARKRAWISCTACAKIKRRCGKQQPACARCASKGLSCEYPPPKPSMFVLREESSDSSSSPQSSGSSDTRVEVRSRRVEPSTTLPSFVPSLPYELQYFDPWWFNTPKTWDIDYAPDVARIRPRSSKDLAYARETFLDWLAAWIANGSNPFIHRHLYKHRLLPCIQDAFMTLSCYLAKQSTYDDMLFRIIQDKLSQLVGADVGSSFHDQQSLTDLDPFQHLARTQALLIYEMICLYDGDVRLRKIAECHLPVLLDWIHQAVDAARNWDLLGRFMISDTSREDIIPWDTMIWYSWIMAESLRRTWLTLSAVNGTYLATQDGLGRCFGGMMFTSRSGFWEAPSASAWEEKCIRTYGALVRLTETDKLFAAVKPNELDEFAKTVLYMTFGTEQMERWGVL